MGPGPSSKPPIMGVDGDREPGPVRMCRRPAPDPKSMSVMPVPSTIPAHSAAQTGIHFGAGSARGRRGIGAGQRQR